jgi:hypothetical protein
MIDLSRGVGRRSADVFAGHLSRKSSSGVQGRPGESMDNVWTMFLFWTNQMTAKSLKQFVTPTRV